MHITVLETFDGFLHNTATKARIEKVCEEIFNKLTDGSTQCYICFDSLNVLSLDYEKKTLLIPPTIKDWLVPVPLSDLNDYKFLSTDLVVLKIMNCIDGKKCVKQLESELEINVDKIKLCLQHLYYQGLIYFVDLFQFTNVYRITSNIRLILNELAQESVSILSKTPDTDPFEIFNYYSMLSDKCVMNFLEENPDFIFKIDIEMFVAYGVIRGILQRIHRYCVILEISRLNKENYRKNTDNIIEISTERMLQGNTCMDEISMHLNTDPKSIENDLKDICVFFNK
jgi:nitrogen permease regulator 2-like protein